MINYVYEIGTHKIELKINAYGAQTFYINDKLLKRSFIGDILNRHNFFLDGNSYTLTVSSLSDIDNEHKVILRNNGEIIDEAHFIENKGKILSLDNQEQAWINEIAFPRDIFNHVSLLYLTVLLLDIVNIFLPENAVLSSVFWIYLLIALIFSMYLIIKSLIDGFRNIDETENEIETLS